MQSSFISDTMSFTETFAGHPRLIFWHLAHDGKAKDLAVGLDQGGCPHCDEYRTASAGRDRREVIAYLLRVSNASCEPQPTGTWAFPRS